MSLRKTLLVLMLALGLLTIAAAVSMVFFTTYMQGRVNILKQNLNSVHLGQEIEVDLLAYSRAEDSVVRTILERDINHNLRLKKQHVSSDGELQVMEEAERRILAYFGQVTAQSPTAGLSELNDALRSLRTLVDINLAEARAAEADAARLDRIADRLGIAIAVALLLGIAGVFAWLSMSAFRPVFGICGAMKKFSDGDRKARAPEAGVEEMRKIARQFNEMAEALERQQETQLAFLAGVAHDLRNPIGALRLSTAVLSPERQPPGEARILEIFGVVKRQVDYLNRMVGDLLDACRIEAGHLDLHIEQHDARKLAGEVFELFRQASERHRLTLDVPDRPILLHCDSVRVQQVLNNLVSNAIKYSPEGGEISIQVIQLDKHAAFRVSDSGLGISKDEIHLIFEPFRRARLSPQRIPGVGLGLYVARRIVEAHQGRIQVESDIGQGSTFHVLLPAIAASMRVLTIAR